MCVCVCVCVCERARDSVSPRALHHMVGMLRFMSDINQASLSTPFYSVLVSISIFLALSTVFHSTDCPDNSPFSHSVLSVLFLSALVVISPVNLFMEVFFNPDIIPSG